MHETDSWQMIFFICFFYYQQFYALWGHTESILLM